MVPGMSDRLRQYCQELSPSQLPTMESLLSLIADKGSYHTGHMSDAQLELVNTMLTWPTDKTGPG